jgi:hypothetical protein
VPMRSNFSRNQSNQPHNAHHFETATVYYRWHPLFGQTLSIEKRMRDRHGDHIFCALPDGTICSLPAWMFNPESTNLTLGSPAISVGALAELRDLIDALQSPPPCGIASLNHPAKEGVNEATSEPQPRAIQPPSPRNPGGRTVRRKGAGTRSRPRGTARNRGSRNRKSSSARRRK